MNQNKEQFDKNNTEFDKWDLILTNTLVSLLIIGLIVAGIVVILATK